MALTRNFKAETSLPNRTELTWDQPIDFNNSSDELIITRTISHYPMELFNPVFPTKATDSRPVEIFRGSTIAGLNEPVVTSESFRSTFTSGTTADFGNGSLTGTIGGTGGSIVANQFVTGATGGYLDYDKQSNYNPNIGTIRFKFAPSFTGFPPNGFNILYHQFIAVGNSMMIDWKSNGSVALFATTNTGTIIFNTLIAGASAVTGAAGVSQEWELNYDLPGNSVELYVDGTFVGGTTTFTGTQVDTASPGSIRLGAFSNGTSPIDGTYDDLQLYSTVQHTANFTGEIPRTIGTTPPDSISVNGNTITDLNATFPTSPSLAGRLLRDSSSQVHRILSNTSDTITLETTPTDGKYIILADFPTAIKLKQDFELDIRTTAGAGFVQDLVSIQNQLLKLAEFEVDELANLIFQDENGDKFLIKSNCSLIYFKFNSFFFSRHRSLICRT